MPATLSDTSTRLSAGGLRMSSAGGTGDRRDPIQADGSISAMLPMSWAW